MASVAIVGGTEDIRLLLRGLARLHRHQVVAEGAVPETLDALPRLPNGAVVLLEADLDESGTSQRLTELLRSRPDLKLVLITARWSPRIEEQARLLGIPTVLRRPFAVHQLVQVLSPGGASAKATAGGSDGDGSSSAKG